MNTFDKEHWDVARIFLAYLAFLGNSTKVGIALKMPAEVVEVLAAKEDWPTKLRAYQALRHDERRNSTDLTISRVVTRIQACHLRVLINQFLNRAYRFTDEESLLDWLSPRNPRTNKPKFEPRILIDMVRALNVASRILDRTCEETPVHEPEAYTKEELASLRAAISRAMRRLDQLPGMDSVAAVEESLALWGRRHDGFPDYDPVI
ncbi:MAG TPA: hypothetical protein VN578_22570 [Candidatus Binatia bacterium]|nr:hypothetical protein [Candidatus Binatia bacterium]